MWRKWKCLIGINVRHRINHLSMSHVWNSPCWFWMSTMQMMHEWLEEGTAGVCTHSTLHSKLWSREKTSRLLLTQKNHLRNTLVPLVTNLSFFLHFCLEICKYQMYFRIKKNITNPSCNEPGWHTMFLMCNIYLEIWNVGGNCFTHIFTIRLFKGNLRLQESKFVLDFSQNLNLILLPLRPMARCLAKMMGISQISGRKYSKV